MWAQGFGSWGKGDSDGNAAAFDRNSKGFVMGVDGGAPFLGGGEFRAGVFGHYVETDLDVDSMGSHARLKRYGGGAYIGMTFGGLEANLGFSASDVHADVRRTIAFAGTATSATGARNGSEMQAFGELGYRLPMGAATFIEPYAAASIANVRLHRTAEAGAITRVDVTQQQNDLGTLDLGLRAGASLGTVRLSGRAAARHWFGDRQVASLVALDLAQQQPFLVRTTPFDDWGAVAALDASVQLGGVSASLGYSGVFSSSVTDHAAKATVAVHF